MSFFKRLKNRRLITKQVYKLFNFLLKKIDPSKNYFFISPTSDWFYDKKYKITNINQTFSVPRQKNLQEILKLTIGLKGDYYEFGVFEGKTSYLICDFIKKNSPESYFYGYDSFEGLSNPCQFDGTHWSKNDLKASMNVVDKKLKEFDNYKIIKGWLPDTLQKKKITNIAFAHFDLDLYEPTYETLKLIYESVVTGGILLFDDYGLSTCPGVTKAVNDFFEVNKIINLASGGTFIIKN